MKPLPAFNGTIESSNGISCVQFQASFQMMQFFFECGLYSGHFFQPKVNHRDFDVGVLYDKRVTDSGTQVPPLLKSMLNPGEGDDFTIQTPLSCLMYEVTETKSDGEVDLSLAIYTTLKCKVETESGVYPELLRGRLRNRQAASVSGNVYRWTPTRSVAVSSARMAALSKNTR